MADLGRSLLLQDKYVDAEAVLRDGLRIRAKKLPDDWGTFHTRSLLGEALLRQKKYADAEPLLLQGYQGMKQRAAKIPLPDKPRLTEALGRLVRLYEATGDKDKADAWRRQWEQAKAAPGTTKKGPVSGGR
jgi:TolA-binding protein